MRAPTPVEGLLVDGLTTPGNVQSDGALQLGEPGLVRDGEGDPARGDEPVLGSREHHPTTDVVAVGTPLGKLLDQPVEVLDLAGERRRDGLVGDLAVAVLGPELDRSVLGPRPGVEPGDGLVHDQLQPQHGCFGRLAAPRRRAPETGVDGGVLPAGSGVLGTVGALLRLRGAADRVVLLGRASGLRGARHTITPWVVVLTGCASIVRRTDNLTLFSF